MKPVSVIVPVYNVKEVLPRCLDSIINQSFKDLEIILIDDGSSDGSEKICDDYQLKDKRIRVIHQQNKGISCTRNVGLDQVSGNYIIFIDSDDWVEVDFIESVMEYIGKSGVDICFFGFRYEDENGSLIAEKVPSKLLEYNSSNIANHLVHLYKKDLFGYNWCKIFKTQIIKDYHLRFKEETNYFEDEDFTARYCKFINSMACLNIQKYHYIKYSNIRKSLTNDKNTSDLYNRHEVFKSWVELLKGRNEFLYQRSYDNLKFLFSNIIWDKTLNHQEKKLQNKSLIESSFYSYQKQYCSSLKSRILLIIIKRNLFNLYKWINLTIYYFDKLTSIYKGCREND